MRGKTGRATDRGKATGAVGSAGSGTAGECQHPDWSSRAKGGPESEAAGKGSRNRVTNPA